MKKLLCNLLSILIFMLTFFNVIAFADNNVELKDNYDTSKNHLYEPATENIFIDGNKGVPSDDSNVEFLDNGSAFISSGRITYTVDIKTDATFNIALKYCTKSDNGIDSEISILIDNQSPFNNEKKFKMPIMWKDSGAARVDGFGNQFSAEQIEYDDFTVKALSDDSSIEAFPYLFDFSTGQHSISIEVYNSPMIISGVILQIPDNSELSYSQLKEEYQLNNYNEYNGEVLKIEGEKPYYKNSDSIISLSDNTTKEITPSSATKSLINYIGGINWKNLNEEIVWKITVPQDGLYKLGFVCKQDQIVNGNSYRHLKIDGKTPFKEAASLRFGYSINWKFEELSDNNGEPYLFYLEKGEHTMSLSVTLGPTAEIYSRLKSVTETLGNLYIDIVMITGETPDENRDYELHKQIPDFLKTITNLKNEIDDIVKNIQLLTSQKSNSQIAALKNMSRVLNSMIENSYTAHLYVGDYYSEYTTVSSWLYEMTKMPLSIDQIQLAAPNGQFNINKSNFIEKFVFAAKRFLFSFVNDYAIKNTTSKNEIKIWVNWGNDQAQVLKSLIEESFTPKTGINVNLQVVNADLIKGMLSDNQPDLSLHMSRATPVNLAMRGALYDLTNFEDYKEVLTRFGDTASEPYWYNNGLYALPDQQSFYLMFYRKDILDSLGLSVPNTWDEFMAATAVLQRNNMNAFIPYTRITAANTTDTGVGGLNLFPSILMQHGGSIYNEARNESMLSSKISLKAFKYWTDMYTQYKLPIEADFYNRFKSGTCPLGVAVYTQYTTFLQTAPEIEGRWGIALIPGVEQDDGSINRFISGSGTGCSILEKSQNKEAAWEFLKWWTEANTQVRYNKNVESILGSVSRITTANVEAFSRMGWDKKDLDILLEQRKQICEIPEIPGSYFLTRSVDQAFFAVINGRSTVKDSLSKWGAEANNEIARKISEYQSGE